MKQIRWWMLGGVRSALLVAAVVLGPAAHGQYEPAQVKPPAPTSPMAQAPTTLPIPVPTAPAGLAPVPAPLTPVPPTGQSTKPARVETQTITLDRKSVV